MKLTAPGGGPVFAGPHMLLPADKVRHVGEAVAMVVARTRAQALDAAEAVEVEYEELPFVIGTEDALKPGAPTVWDEVPDNVLVDTHVRRQGRDRPRLRRGRSCGARRSSTSAASPPCRWSCAPASPTTTPRPAATRSTPAPAARCGRRRSWPACSASRPTKLRVLSYDVGGNFGSRNRPYVEFGLVLWAAGKLKRPVKYTATRSEAFLTDYQGRDLVTKVELALREDGRFLAMRADNISNVGARCVSLSPLSKGAGPDHRLLRHSGGDAARARGVHQHHADQRLSLVPAGRR